MFNFLKRDKDITYKEEFHYIIITLGETIKILYLNLEDNVLKLFFNIFYSIY